jgi:hypothetical protein
LSRGQWGAVGASTPFLRPLFMASSKATKHGFGTALVGSSASGSGEVTVCSGSEVTVWPVEWVCSTAVRRESRYSLLCKDNIPCNNVYIIKTLVFCIHILAVCMTT